MKKTLDTILQDADTALKARRNFLRGAGMTGLGLAGAALTAGRLGAFDSPAFASSPYSGDNDTEIAQFALNLEYLEAEFYTVATTGKTLAQSGFDVSGIGQSGATTGGNQVDFSNESTGKLAAIAAEITSDEQQHVLLLRQMLGSQAIAKPTINLEALGIGFASAQEFLTLSRAFEDTGVSAYGGAAPLLQSKTHLSTAVRIGLTEALHVSAIRVLIAENNVPTTKLDSQDILPPPTGTMYFANDNQGLTIIRTTSEVLAIVYHNSATGTSSGGFFPNGVNGPINTV